MNKIHSVEFVKKELLQDLEKLSKGDFADKKLHEFINRGLDDLKENPSCGIKLPRRLWPKEYLHRYRIDNLWKYDLPNGWRLIYTIINEKVRIISVILEWLSHKEYEKRFKY